MVLLSFGKAMQRTGLRLEHKYQFGGCWRGCSCSSGRHPNSLLRGPPEGSPGWKAELGDTAEEIPPTSVASLERKGSFLIYCFLGDQGIHCLMDRVSVVQDGEKALGSLQLVSHSLSHSETSAQCVVAQESALEAY